MLSTDSESLWLDSTVSTFSIAGIELGSRVERVTAMLVMGISREYIYFFNHQEAAQQVRSGDFTRYFAIS